MEFRKSNSKTLSSRLSCNKGFVTTALIGLFPIIAVLLMILGFQQYLTKNWMHSLHTCRVDLLKTQRTSASHLDRLLKLNPQAKALRLALRLAYIELGIAAASVPPNPGWVAAVKLRIQNIKAQQRALGAVQKMILQTANLQMIKGVLSVVEKLKTQNKDNQKKLPSFFKYQIQTIIPQWTQLAVIPDSPETAPVYELKKDFIKAQTIHVSWINLFQITEKGPLRWLIQKHHKFQSCSASLDPNRNFQEILTEGKPSRKFFF